MKKMVFICNRCGKEIKTKGSKIIPMFFDTESEDMTEPVSADQEDRHYCHGCTNRILQELLAPLDADGNEKPPPKKRQRLDAGKIMALHRAGWDNAKIADEMGADERQIYQCIRYQNNKGSEVPNGKENEDES